MDVQVDDCCDMDSESDCHESDHIVKEFEINDFQVVNAEKLVSLPSFTLNRNFAPVLGTSKKENPNFYSSHLIIEAPPIILLNQQFLC